MSPTLAERVLAYSRRNGLLRAGDRVGVAVSGGADSVALLRLLLELRNELGVVLSVVHFNHRIRGAEADTDEQFVAALAGAFSLPCHLGSGDAPAHAAAEGLSLETAARDLRHGYFRHLLASGQASRIAIAHSQDDQAETVLLRLTRGAGTRGLAGIYPLRPLPECAPGAALVRPLLELRRCELEAWLKATGQEWREDATNRDLRHSRNRVRHVLLPLLERDFNPAIRQVLAETAAIAREEEACWQSQVERVLAQVTHPGRDRGEIHLRVATLAALPLALQRRVVRHALGNDGLDFQHVDQVLALLESPAGSEVELRGRGRLRRVPRCPQSGDDSPHPKADPELVIGGDRPAESAHYEYELPVPGEVLIAEAGLLLRASVVGPEGVEDYNRRILELAATGSALRVRNWQAGDRYWPAHTGSPKKVKELLQTRRVPREGRARWPVAVNAAGELVWLKGFPPPGSLLAASGDAGVLIEAVEIGSGEST